jgi:hypothetical protein
METAAYPSNSDFASALHFELGVAGGERRRATISPQLVAVTIAELFAAPGPEMGGVNPSVV